MIRLLDVSLQSEMDLVLSNQKFIKVAELLKLNLSLKSTFGSAISEVVRVMTEHTDEGVLEIGIGEQNRQYQLICKVFYPLYVAPISSDLFLYAKRLVPLFSTTTVEDLYCIEFSIGLPKSLNLTSENIQKICNSIRNLGPLSSYEEIKISKNVLFEKAKLQKEELKASKFLNDLKSEFISMASHELKTPITILKAYGQLALSSKVTTLSQVQSIVEKMNSQCTKLSMLALQLLDSAKIENGQLEYVMTSTDFNPFLNKTIEDLKYLIPGHHINTDLSDSPHISLDQLRIEQVLSNLLSNAAKYSEPDTEIIVKTELSSEREYMILSISDQGIGIADDGLTKIFEKFHREPEVLGKQSGLGIGMYIASQIIHAHNGKIWVTSKQGVGSTFFITLPMA
ncbi:signal transduction histidine kinase [Pedobacter sp. CAN_A7]|uniref:sensor histidine kinase n=1 Tax=Pedobacter sp. CAN_A7 TaxID=2787722 RepID=UPI0018C94658